MKKILIPSLLGAVIAIAGIFAFIQVDDATAVHTTILTTMPAQHVIVVSAGTTALNNIPLLTTGVTGTEYVGTITAMILDTSEAAGAADLDLACSLFASFADDIDDDNAADVGDSALSAASDFDTIGESETTDMAAGDNCEIIHATLAANTEAIITIHIDSTT